MTTTPNDFAAAIVDEMGSTAWFVETNEHGYVANIHSATTDEQISVRFNGNRAVLTGIMAGWDHTRPLPRATVAIERGARAAVSAIRSRILTDAYRAQLATIARRRAERDDYEAQRATLAKNLERANVSVSTDADSVYAGRDVEMRWSPSGHGYARARVYADSVSFDSLSVTGVQAVAIMALLAEMTD